MQGPSPAHRRRGRGAARIFEVDEIVMLRIYGVLLEMEIPASRAGEMACDFGREMRLNPEASFITYAQLPNGISAYVAGFIGAENVIGGAPYVALRLTFDIAAMRKEIVDLLEEENKEVGE